MDRDIRRRRREPAASWNDHGHGRNKWEQEGCFHCGCIGLARRVPTVQRRGKKNVRHWGGPRPSQLVEGILRVSSPPTPALPPLRGAGALPTVLAYPTTFPGFGENGAEP